MKYIYNSLGSNYSLEIVKHSLKILFKPDLWRDRRPVRLLEKELGKIFSGEVRLFYKGRDAISYTLNSLGVGIGDQVIVQGLTCLAVEEGVGNSGAKAVFADLAPRSLNFDTASLTTVLKKAKRVKAVLVQHNLGYPADMEMIKRFCDKHQLILIEDLAHAFGAKTPGKSVGDYADAVILSFGRDKIVDGVSGGAAIIRSKEQGTSSKLMTEKRPVPNGQIIKDLCYPFLTYLIRYTYPFLVGKPLHFLLTKMGILGTPLENPLPRNTDISSPAASLTLIALNDLKIGVTRRKKIAAVYHKTLGKWSFKEVDNFNTSACLRYPVLVKNRDEVIKKLKTKGVFVSDTWYKKVVDGGKFGGRSQYKKGTCMRAEAVSGKILNLPTHRYVDEKTADKIAKIVRSYV